MRRPYEKLTTSFVESADMTKDEFEKTKQALRDTRKAATESPEAALRYLKEIGILDEKGELAAEYSRKVA